MVRRTFLAVVHKEDDMYVAQCPEVGTASQGYTLEEAVANPVRGQRIPPVPTAQR